MKEKTWPSRIFWENPNLDFVTNVLEWQSTAVDFWRARFWDVGDGEFDLNVFFKIR